MTIGGIFWMGMNYWRKTHQELVKLQHTSATPETIEDYYQKVKAGSFLVGYGVYMNDNTVHVDDNYTWHIYDNYEEVRKYCEQINSNK